MNRADVWGARPGRNQLGLLGGLLAVVAGLVAGCDGGSAEGRDVPYWVVPTGQVCAPCAGEVDFMHVAVVRVDDASSRVYLQAVD
ncbi:hypothetical protein ACWC5F_12375 [Streptomyces sp. NPDC001272]